MLAVLLLLSCCWLGSDWAPVVQRVALACYCWSAEPSMHSNTLLPCLPACPPARRPAEVEDSGGASGGGADFLSSLLQQSYRVEPPGSGDMRHGTEGWKCLETSFRVRERGLPGVAHWLAGHSWGVGWSWLRL